MGSKGKAEEDSMSAELGENISMVNLAGDVEEPQDIQGNSFTDAVAGQSIVAFVQGRMRDVRAGNDTCIVAKHTGLAANWSAEAAECMPCVHDLFVSQTSSDKLRTACCSFNTSLHLQNQSA
jgi:hypothetical protein